MMESRRKKMATGSLPRFPEVHSCRQQFCLQHQERDNNCSCSSGDVFSSLLSFGPLPLLVFQCIKRVIRQDGLTFSAQFLPGPMPEKEQVSIQWRSCGNGCRKLSCVTPVICSRWGGSGHWGPDVMTPAGGWKGGPGLTPANYLYIFDLFSSTHWPSIMCYTLL